MSNAKHVNKKKHEEIPLEENLKSDNNIGQDVEKDTEVPDAAAQIIEKLEKEVAELKDKYIRKVAEFENYKRRTENEHFNLLKYAAESFIIKILPVIDDFERSIAHIENAKDIDSLKNGIKLIYDKLLKILTEQGVTKIESVGKPFDVDYHEALMQRKADGVEPHIVVDEIETGYMYKEKVIRHSKVIVSEDQHEEAPAQSQEENSEGK